MKPKRSVTLALILFVSCLFGLVFSGIPGGHSLAQTDLESWSAPENLSKSGGNTNPVAVTDTDGILHVIWQDTFADYVYSQFQGESWSTPQAATFPFTTEDDSIPHLTQNGKGQIFAFWTNGDNDLYYSFVSSNFMTTPARWSTPSFLASAAAGFDVTPDSDGRFHLAYVRTLDTTDAPSGVYYLRSGVTGTGWSAPAPLSISPQLRTVTSDDVNLKVAVASPDDSNRIYVTWDNRPLNRVFYARSIDNGTTWDPPLEIEKPETSADLATPYNIQVTTSDSQVILIWNSGQIGESCSLYYQVSEDLGESWSEKKQVFEPIFGCPAQSIFIQHTGDFILLSLTINEQINLIAWNGIEWSELQPQAVLSSFNDPDTFNLVQLGCLNYSNLNDGTLYLVGCDTGPGGDIWAFRRSIQSIDTWYPEPSIWQTPAVFYSGQFHLDSLALLGDSEGRIHAFWGQSDLNTSSGSAEAIYYARLLDGIWSTPRPILTSPTGNAVEPVVAIDPEGRLVAVWEGGQTGEIYYSWADASLATNSDEWADPVALPSPHPIASSPDLAIDRGGILYVAYAIPLNEDRGIYLVQSVDGGNTWSDPIQVFDASAPGWERVDKPKLTVTDDGIVHLQWMQSSVAEDTGGLKLYYDRSLDGGWTWNTPTEVIDHPINWSEMIGISPNVVSRIWEETISGRAIIMNQYSKDSGLLWTFPTNITNPGETGPMALAQDTAGRIHLVQVIRENLGNLDLRHQIWSGEAWTVDENLNLGSGDLTASNRVALAISPAGELSVVYTNRITGQNGDEDTIRLLYTSRPVEIPPANLEPLPPPTPRPTPVNTPVEAVETAVPPATGILEQLGAQNSAARLLANNPWVGLVIGFLAAGAIVVVVFVLSIRSRRGR